VVLGIGGGKLVLGRAMRSATRTATDGQGVVRAASFGVRVSVVIPALIVVDGHSLPSLKEQ
jgi:hypothetical protein